MTVAIIIPTKNRSQFLIRQLAYYAGVGGNHTIFVGDLSDDQHLESTHSSVSKFEHRTEIKYLQLPGLKEDEAIQEIAKRIEEPYVALASDDDFLIPGALGDCADFLDSHSEYSSAHGLALSFAVASDWACGEFVRTRLDPQWPSEETNGRLRLLEFLDSAWPARLCVQRTDDFRAAAALASKPPDKDFRELLASCVPVIRGKSKQLGRLFSLRQAHIQYYPIAYACDWITGPNWFASYTFFADRLKEELVRQDAVGSEEAEEVVKEAFQSYLARRLATGRAAPERSVGPPPRRRWWRRAAGTFPGVRQVWRLGQAISTINTPMPGISGKAAEWRNPDELSLPALLRPSSPYHADFMPVYRAVTTPAD